MTWLPSSIASWIRFAETPPERLERSSSVDPLNPSCWRYSPERHGSAEAFARSLDFQFFTKHIEGFTETLSQLDLETSAGRFNARQPFRQLRNNLLRVDREGNNIAYGADAAAMYGAGAELLDRVASMAEDDAIPLALRQAEVRKLGPLVIACAPAAINALEAAIEGLDIRNQELTGRYRAIREDIVQQVAVRSVERHFVERLSWAPGDQVHLVGALNRRLHARLGWPWHRSEDRFAHVAPPEDMVDTCLTELAEALRSDATATRLAEDYLGRFTAAMHERLRQTGDPAFPTLDDIQACAAPLRPLFGTAPSEAALMRLNADESAYRPSTDTTLVALHFLARLRSADALQQDEVPLVMATWLDEGRETRLLSQGSLAWVEDGDGQRVCTDDDIGHLDASDRRSLRRRLGRPVLHSVQDLKATLTRVRQELDRSDSDIPGDQLIAQLTAGDDVGRCALASALQTRPEADEWRSTLLLAGRTNRLSFSDLMLALRQCGAIRRSIVSAQSEQEDPLLRLALDAFEEGLLTAQQLTDAVLGRDDPSPDPGGSSWMRELDEEQNQRAASNIFGAFSRHKWRSGDPDARAKAKDLLDKFLAGVHDRLLTANLWNTNVRIASLAASIIVDRIGDKAPRLGLNRPY